MTTGDTTSMTLPQIRTSPAADAYLLHNDTVADYRQALVAAIDQVADTIARTTKPFSGVSPAALAPEVSAIDLDQPLHDTVAALEELERTYLRDAVYFHHPRYLAHLNCPVAIPALLAEAILSAVNSSLDTWDQSAGGTLIERHLIDWTARRIGFGDAADGVFTSGGTQSNLHALLLAREEAVVRAQLDAGTTLRRSQILPRLRILASEVAHFSVQKAASLLGLETDAVLSVPIDADRQMRPDAAARLVDECRRDGDIVMAVVATAGTTDFGSIDPLPQLAKLCAETDTWLHVDAAYGCGLLVSPTRRHLLDGVEHADSVTVDFHKSFFQPVSSSAVVVQDGATLRHVTYYADYLNPARMAAAGVPNQVDKSLQTTRRFDALKLWLTLRIMGPDAIGKLFDDVLDLADDVWRMLAADRRFEVLGPSPLSTVVFRYLPPDGQHADETNLYARQALAASGQAMVAATTVDGAHYLKFTLLNPRTTVHHVVDVLDLIAQHAEDFLARRRGADPSVELSQTR